MVKLSIVGHLTVDEIIFGGKRCTSMGGVACYASLSARALGAEVKIFSRIGRDFPEEYLKVLMKAGIDTSHIMVDEYSTRFRIIYSEEKRTLRILSRAGDIDLNLKDHLGSDAVYLGPVAWELSLESVKFFSEGFRRTALDPQGLMRTAGEDGFIKLRQLDLDIPNLWVLRISREEAKMLSGSRNPYQILDWLRNLGAEITILTLGRLGAFIAHGEEIFKVPSYRVEPVDPTGAGDVFGGSFLTSLLESGDIRWAASIGSAMASIVVEKPSFQALLSPKVLEEAERRAEQILESVEEL